MSNEEEAFEDYATPLGMDLTVPTLGDYRSGMTLMAWRAFQAGAAYQRTQAQPADALVEALNGMLLHIREPENESEFQWSGHFEKQKAAFVAAREALAKFHAAQEGK